MCIIGEEAREVFTIFRWDDDESHGKVVIKFKAYCQPRKNVCCTQNRFNLRLHDPEEAYD